MAAGFPSGRAVYLASHSSIRDSVPYRRVNRGVSMVASSSDTVKTRMFAWRAPGIAATVAGGGEDGMP